jgi:phosphate:Na+ symporter
LTILGGVALTLYGVQQIRDNVMQGMGATLRHVIEKSTSNVIKAFGAGILVTGLIQTATATALIVSSFAARGLVPLVAALAVLLGADVGTSLVAQVFTLNLNWLGPIFVFIGMMVMAVSPVGRSKYAGGALVGLGVMLVGLGIITHAAEPMEQSAALRAIMGELHNDRIMTLCVGVLLTWLAQSSLAFVLLVMSFAGANIMAADTAFTLVLGAHVGAAVTPLLMNIGQNNDARLLVIGNFLLRLVSAFAFIAVMDMVMVYQTHLGHSIERQVVNFHTASSVLRALVFLPFLGVIADLLRRLVPIHVNKDDPSRAQYLDTRDLGVPSVALAAAERETLRLSDLVMAMMDDVKVVFEQNDPHALQRLIDRDNHVDRLYEQIKFYLAKLSRESMTDKQSRRHIELLMFITNLEHIGDIIVRNLCELAQKKWRNNLSFSKQGWQEIEDYHTHVMANFRLAINVFHSEDAVLARELVRQKEALQKETVTATGSHFNRLRQGLLESLRSSSLHLDIIRDLRRVNDYLTSVAYNILEDHGALQSRVREDV